MAPDYLPNYSEYQAAVRATAELRDGDPKKTPPIEFGRMEADRLRPDRAAAIRDDRRDSKRRAGARARHAQHPRPALRHLQGRLRPASRPRARCRPGAPTVCEEFRQPAGRARARRRARQAVRPQSRSCGDADVLHPVLVQGSVRHQGHALDRRRRRRLRHGFPGARPHAGGAAARHRRDHLRQGEHHRIQRPRPRQSGRPELSDQGVCRRCSAISAAPGPAIRATPTTRRAPPRSARARAPASRSARTW